MPLRGVWLKLRLRVPLKFGFDIYSYVHSYLFVKIFDFNELNNSISTESVYDHWKENNQLSAQALLKRCLGLTPRSATGHKSYLKATISKLYVLNAFSLLSFNFKNSKIITNNCNLLS